MTWEKVELDTFKPPHHKLKQHKLTALLKEYNSQFTQDETSIGTTPLMEISQVSFISFTSYRVTPNLATAETPFFLIYGRDPNLPLH